VNRNIAELCRLACASALCLASLAASAKAVEPGAKRLYKEHRDGHEHCVTVRSVDVGVDGEDWAWFTFRDDPKRMAHAPAADLSRSCEPAGAADSAGSAPAGRRSESPAQ